MNRQTTLAKNNNVPRNWWVVDATDLVLGRMAVPIARTLMGKTKPEYTPHHDVGDFVIVTNATKIKITGNKREQKFHETYSGHPSGRKLRTWQWMIENHPEDLILNAVRRMLPKNKMASAQLTKLKVFPGEEHTHQAQQPKALELQL